MSIFDRPQSKEPITATCDFKVTYELNPENLTPAQLHDLSERVGYAVHTIMWALYSLRNEVDPDPAAPQLLAWPEAEYAGEAQVMVTAGPYFDTADEDGVSEKVAPSEATLPYSVYSLAPDWFGEGSGCPIYRNTEGELDLWL